MKNTLQTILLVGLLAACGGAVDQDSEVPADSTAVDTTVVDTTVIKGLDSPVEEVDPFTELG